MGEVLSDSSDLEIILDHSDLPRYFTQPCAPTSPGEIPGVEHHCDKRSRKLTEITSVPALAELSSAASLPANEQFVLASLNAFLWRMKVRRARGATPKRLLQQIRPVPVIPIASSVRDSR